MAVISDLRALGRHKSVLSCNLVAEDQAIVHVLGYSGLGRRTIDNTLTVTTFPNSTAVIYLWYTKNILISINR